MLLILIQEVRKSEWITERNNFTGKKTYYNLNCEIFLMSLILPQLLFVQFIIRITSISCGDKCVLF